MLTFAGMQKLTLIDYPDRTACTLFVKGCNFLCPFCHNASLIPASGNNAEETTAACGAVLTEDEVCGYLQKRRAMLDAVCVSGGEPLMHDGLPGFAARAKDMGYLVKIDTNGSFPEKLKTLVESGLADYVAMDIKNTPDKYPQTIGVPSYDTSAVMESAAFLLSRNMQYEFRTTVVREFHTADDIAAIASYIKGAEKYFLQRFEQPQTALRPGLTAYSDKEMQDICGHAKKVLPCTYLRG